MEQTTIIEAGARDRVVLRAWRVMVTELWSTRELVVRLSQRNIAGQFRQSFLGYIWMVLPPLALTVVFTVLREANIVAVPMPKDSMPYMLFALVGATAWGTFTQAALSATGSLAAADTLVSKIYFPREVLVISAVATNLVNLLVQIGVLLLSCALLRYAPAPPSILALLLFVPIFALGLGIGFFLAPLNAIMGDIQRLLAFIFQFGMFLAPTVYPTPSLATSASGWEVGLFLLHKLNPVTHFLDAMRSLMETGTWPAGPGLAIATALSFVVMLVGWRFFHASEPFIAERL